MAVKSCLGAILGALAATGGIGGAYLYVQKDSDQTKCNKSKDEECSTNFDNKTNEEENPKRDPAIYYPSVTGGGSNSQERKDDHEKSKGSSTSTEQLLAKSSKAKKEEFKSSTTRWFPSLFTVVEQSPETPDVLKGGKNFPDSKIHAASIEKSDESSKIKKETTPEVKSSTTSQFPSLFTIVERSPETEVHIGSKNFPDSKIYVTSIEKYDESIKTKKETTPEVKSSTTSWFPSIFITREKSPEAPDVLNGGKSFPDSKIYAASIELPDELSVTKNVAKSSVTKNRAKYVLINTEPIHWKSSYISRSTKPPKENSKNLDSTKEREAMLPNEKSQTENAGASSTFGKWRQKFSGRKDKEGVKKQQTEAYPIYSPKGTG